MKSPYRAAASRLRLAPPPLRSILRTTPEHRTVVLTFDDGPEPGPTDKVLDALDDARMSATFFMLSARARKHPGLVAEVVAAGHEIALHGPDHRRLTDFSARQVYRRTKAAMSELEDVASLPVRWFRPPYGKQGVGAVGAVRALGLVPVLWSGGLRDWEHMSDDSRIEQAIPEAVPGAILLGHDGFAASADGVDDGFEPTVDRYRVTRELGRAIDAAGLRGCSLGEALSNAGPVTSAQFRW